jgi:hypothetical protein
MIHYTMLPERRTLHGAFSRDLAQISEDCLSRIRHAPFPQSDITLEIIPILYPH